MSNDPNLDAVIGDESRDVDLDGDFLGERDEVENAADVLDPTKDIINAPPLPGDDPAPPSDAGGR